MPFTISILISLLLLPGILLSAGAGEEKELSDDLVKQIVSFASIALQEMDPDSPGVCYAKQPNEHNETPCYPLAWLYKTAHPLNPYYGKTGLRDRAVEICDYIVRIKSTLEWPLYNLCQTYALLEPELDSERKARWREYAAYYIGTRGIRPYLYTSFNHEAWSATAILRAGQVFGNPAWVDRAHRLMHQLLKIQNELGYFDEGPHHGPSMKYNQVQLAPMLLFADYSGDAATAAAAKKLADFMLRYSFPDGSPVGTFDGRQSWSLGYFGTLCYGFDRWPVGKEMNRRIYRTRKKWGILDPQARHYNLSDWYAYFGYGFILDEYLSLRPAAPSSALPQDSDGYLRFDKGPTFAGGVARNHGWMVAVSAINSDIPQIGSDIYRLERQSRLDLWQEKAGLVIGGGHNIREAPIPLANFCLLTGYNAVDCDFGILSGGNFNDRLAVYLPRHVEADLSLERQILREAYGQGDLSFTVQPLDDSHLRIMFGYDVFAAKKLFVQLPLIVFFNSRVLVDGAPAVEGRVKGNVCIQNPTTGTSVTFSIPPGAEAYLRKPVPPLRWYIDEHKAQRYEPYYGIQLLSVKIENPQGAGGGVFEVVVEDLKQADKPQPKK